MAYLICHNSITHIESSLDNLNFLIDPPEGKTVLDGLEVKVAFGETWKESLTELSGGQRSLLALSLILSGLEISGREMYTRFME